MAKSDIHTWINPWIYPWISISTATLQIWHDNQWLNCKTKCGNAPFPFPPLVLCFSSFTPLLSPPSLQRSGPLIP